MQAVRDSDDTAITPHPLTTLAVFGDMMLCDDAAERDTAVRQVNRSCTERVSE